MVARKPLYFYTDTLPEFSSKDKLLFGGASEQLTVRSEEIRLSLVRAMNGFSESRGKITFGDIDAQRELCI